MVVELDQPGVPQPVKQLGIPVKLSRTPGAIDKPGPALGEHTDEVLHELGYGDDEVEQLKQAGAVAGATAGAQGSFMA
jgi:crotonobetainyl-CoA:carnitine CoA-transferase CaiB-like acyl-CoA transferase